MTVGGVATGTGTEAAGAGEIDVGGGVALDELEIPALVQAAAERVGAPTLAA